MIVVDPSSGIPPFEQMRAQLEAEILSGRATGGSRLPTVRQLASDLGVAPGTVQSAYRELEAAGLIVTRGSAGTRVAENRVADADLLAAAADFAATAHAKGLSQEDAVSILRGAWGA